jgi:proteasome accessory factor C
VSAATGTRMGRRLERILLLLPYAIRNPGVGIDELSDRFGVDRDDLVDDLQLVFLCGLPGYGPGDLIDVSLEGDRVWVSMADYFRAPLKLTPAEALALYAGGAALVGVPGMEQADALRSALAKLAHALGGAGDVTPVQVNVAEGPSRHLESLQRALAEGHRVALEYYSAGRGALTSRTVDPWGLVASLGHWYLIGADSDTGDERMFRVDRIKAATVLSQDSEVPADFDPGRYRNAFVPRAEQTEVTLEISPEAARWFVESYPLTGDEELGDGWRRVTLVAGGIAWAATLVLRLGRDVRAINPPEVDAEARRLAAEIAARHQDP